jgi:hypothetical protein
MLGVTHIDWFDAVAARALAADLNKMADELDPPPKEEPVAELPPKWVEGFRSLGAKRPLSKKPRKAKRK